MLFIFYYNIFSSGVDTSEQLHVGADEDEPLLHMSLQTTQQALPNPGKCGFIIGCTSSHFRFSDPLVE